MYSRLYTYYDIGNLDDATWFVGNYDITDATKYAGGSVATPYIALLPGETPTEAEDDDANAKQDKLTPIDYTDDNIVWHMQIDNPGTGATPARDGFYAISRLSLAYTTTGTSDAVGNVDPYKNAYVPTYTWTP